MQNEWPSSPSATSPGHLRHPLAHGRQQHGRARVRRRRRAEVRRHQRVLVDLALEPQVAARLPGVPDRVQRQHVLAHARGRARPDGAVAALDVGAHLRAEAEREPPAGERLQIPAGVGHVHRRARERERDRGRDAHARRRLGGLPRGEERVAARLGDADAVEPQGLDLCGLCTDRGDRGPPENDVAEHSRRLSGIAPGQEDRRATVSVMADDLTPRSGSRLSRRQREDRGFQLVVVGGAAAGAHRRDGGARDRRGARLGPAVHRAGRRRQLRAAVSPARKPALTPGPAGLGAAMPPDHFASMSPTCQTSSATTQVRTNTPTIA